MSGEKTFTNYRPGSGHTRSLVRHVDGSVRHDPGLAYLAGGVGDCILGELEQLLKWHVLELAPVPILLFPRLGGEAGPVHAVQNARNADASQFTAQLSLRVLVRVHEYLDCCVGSLQVRCLNTNIVAQRAACCGGGVGGGGDASAPAAAATTATATTTPAAGCGGLARGSALKIGGELGGEEALARPRGRRSAHHVVETVHALGLQAVPSAQGGGEGPSESRELERFRQHVQVHCTLLQPVVQQINGAQLLESGHGLLKAAVELRGRHPQVTCVGQLLGELAVAQQKANQGRIRRDLLRRASRTRI
mmetsp:Transcript_8672/g.22096  ORF Transcript_8672/g.22096 Transcript_8672/m.22096 type:complete len:306 (-) Transcript_8672:1643-2560(-)